MIKASCGHYLTDDDEGGFPAAVREYSSEGYPAVGYKNVCRKCLNDLKHSGDLFETESEEMYWLNS